MPQPTPPRIVEAFAINAGAGFIQNPIPVPSQIPLGSAGRASFNDGFPPLTMTPVSAGGIPPSGKDMNGVLFMLSAHITALSAGQPYKYDATLQTAMGGYALGAVLQQATDPTAFWISTVNNNATDPDTGGAGWMSTKSLYATSAPAAGTFNDVVLPGPSDYYLDVDTTAGAVNVTGFVGQRDGQKLIITNIGGNSYTLKALTGSAAGHQIRAAADYPLNQWQSIMLQNSIGAGKWILVL